MENKNNSFLMFLSMVLALLLTGSIAFGYFFGNFGGISIKELKSNYVTKESIKFADLPLEIQKSYIKKDDIKVKPKTNSGLEKVFDELGNPLDVIEGDIDDLQVIIKSLQDRVMFLEQENLFLSNDKNELLKIVQSEKSTRAIEESSLLSKNLEKINEAEKQHYQNISELTMKINDLQRENIALSDQLNSEKQALKDEIEKLNQKLMQEKAKADLSQGEALRAQNLKYDTLEKQKISLESKLEELNKLLKEERESQIITNAKKDKDLVELQNKINALIMEKNTLLTQNSQSVITLEKKYSLKLKDIEQTIQKYQDDKVAIKESYEAKIKQNTLDYMKLVNTLRDENKKLQEELNKVSQSSIAILENSEKSLKDKENEYKKLLEDITKKYNFNVASINAKKTDIEAVLQKSEQEIVSLKKELEEYKLKAQKYSDEMLQLNDKIVTLDTKSRSVDTEVAEQVKENEEKHNKNYKFLNEKIASLESQLKTLGAKYTQDIQEAKILATKKLKDTEAKYTLLNTDFLKIKQELQKRDITLKNLQENIKLVNSEKEHLEKSEHEKLIEIRKSFEDLQKEVKNRESAYLTQINKLKEELKQAQDIVALREKDKEKLGNYLREITDLKKTLKSLDGQIVSSDTVPISDKKRKLALLGSIECDDMNSGNFKVSPTCKTKVAEFLSQYSADNYFEVIPIVGKGGFGSLNKLRSNTKVDIPDTEIDRLTDLANLGLGKHRAKEGGWLIREQFGDFAKISYTVYNIEADGKRGFVIRVYR